MIAPTISLGQNGQRTQVAQKKIVQPMRCRPNVFFLSGEGERCWIFIVPMKFWMGPQHVTQVPNVFPNIFPIALTSSHMFCPKFYVITYIKNPKEEITTYLFWECPMLEYYFFGHGSIKDVHHKRKKKKLNFNRPHN